MTLFLILIIIFWYFTVKLMKKTVSCKHVIQILVLKGKCSCNTFLKRLECHVHFESHDHYYITKYDTKKYFVYHGSMQYIIFAKNMQWRDNM